MDVMAMIDYSGSGVSRSNGDSAPGTRPGEAPPAAQFTEDRNPLTRVFTRSRYMSAVM